MVNGNERLDSLYLDDDQPRDDEIESERTTDLHTAIQHRYVSFCVDLKRRSFQFNGQASLIDRLQKPRPESIVNGYRARDDPFGEILVE